jgi:hypothetical protein
MLKETQDKNWKVLSNSIRIKLFSMSEVLSRVSSLEQALGREEKLRLEMREKLRVCMIKTENWRTSSISSDSKRHRTYPNAFFSLNKMN